MGADVINPLFSSVQLNACGKGKVEEVRIHFNALLVGLEELLPGNSREISIIKTKLEEAAFYSVKALRNYEENRA
jgi:hypothetical protein